MLTVRVFYPAVDKPTGYEYLMTRVSRIFDLAHGPKLSLPIGV